MWLKNIQILNFRNFSRLNLNFSPAINVFEGGNTQGKTNLIEAIYCLGCGFSFRVYEEQSLIRWKQDSFYVGGEGEKRGSFFKFELSLAKNSHKVRRVNSHPVSLRDTKHWLWMVVFSSQDMKIVQAGPFHRRGFLDEVASFVYPDFSYLRFSFNKVLNHRNALLGQYREKRKVNEEEMGGWDAQFVKVGSEVVYLRLKVLKKLAGSLSKIYPHLKGQICHSHLVYSSSFLEAQDEGISLDRIKEKFYQKLKKMRQKEIGYGVSLIGPHRDDFYIEVDGVNQRTFGSQGEQRIAATALKLAEVDLIKEREGEFPVILLDDVPGDLDAQRERFLLNMVKNKGQVFIATQNAEKFADDFLRESLLFKIIEGNVIKK
ncbi:DNA replication/repair protein RecF [Candidatus Aerophobetes bacterium]|nr:DNA replication/repair protein RecF [Candidatus Aerophobetes bacterium]